MRSKQKWALWLVVSAVLATGCGVLNPGPAGTVKQFYSFIEQGKIESAVKLLSIQPGMESMIYGTLSGMTQNIKDKGGIKSLEITAEDTTGETSQVTFTLTYGDGSTKHDSEKLVKKEGEWLILVQK